MMLIFFCSLLICSHGAFVPKQRIIGGNPIPKGEAEYHVSIQHRIDGHFCGGAILSEYTIVTAAHCFDKTNPKDIKVMVGARVLYRDGTQHDVKCIKQNKKFRRVNGLPNDIALIVLETPILSGENAQIIGVEKEEVPDDTPVYMTGWNSTSKPNPLMMIDLSVTNYHVCQEEAHRPVTDKQICTRAKPQQGPCLGDSGSPLVKKIMYGGTRLGDRIENVPELDVTGRYAQIGIMSWGKICAAGAPDVETKISSYTSWIKRNLDDCRYYDD